jgi:hypothetical protein
MRQARCTCGRIVPSDPALAFFEDRSAGTQDDTCRNCRYHKVAHTRKQAGEHVSHFICDRFEPLTEGREFDSYYCGHGGS